MDNSQRSAVAQTLTNELAAAHSRHTAAANRFHLLLKEVPSGLPHPDGSQRIHAAGKEAHDALEAYVRALKRFTDFSVHRVIPSELDLHTNAEQTDSRHP